MKYTQHHVYQIKNTLNGRVYIGSTRNLKKRWAEHRRDLMANKHHSQKLQNAWNKYGEDSFEFSILEVVLDLENLLGQEQHWIDLLCAANRVNYNISLSAASPMLGRSPSFETRLKLAEAMRGNTHGLGVRHTPEARERMAASKRGQKRTSDQKARMSMAQLGNTNKRGFVATEETREKLSISKIGNCNALGYRHSDEARQVISNKKKIYWANKKAVQA